jgi:hypothetical protein
LTLENVLGSRTGINLFYTFLSAIRTITTSSSRISRLKSCFTCGKGSSQSHRSHLLTHDINTGAQGDTGPALILQRNPLLPSIQYVYSETPKTESSGKRGSKLQTSRHQTSGYRNSKVATMRISLLMNSISFKSSFLIFGFHLS